MMWAAVETIAKIIDLALPSKKGLQYNKLQKLLKLYATALRKGNNSKATKAFVQLRAELRKIGYEEGL